MEWSVVAVGKVVHPQPGSSWSSEGTVVVLTATIGPPSSYWI